MILPRLAVVALAALALPNVAHAGLTAMRSQDVVVDDPQSVTARLTGRFELVGLHWRGPGRVEFRAHSLDGGWTVWRTAAPEEEDGPDSGSSEAGTSGWRFGSPWWVGPSNRLQVRTHGRVRRVRAWTVRSRESLVPLRRTAATSMPAIVSRAAWGADESIRRNEPAYAPELRYAVVHHTAGVNSYTKTEAAAIVRAIQRYHVQANGWNDIGYNFLVDRFGTVYEGRYGGVDANVVGAHAVGFNTGSVGVALLGTYGATAPSASAERALSSLLSWRLDLAHVDPASLLTVASGGSPKFAAGVPVTLRAVSGHRDVGLTECPGDGLYGRLPALAKAAAATGLPKLFEPSAVATTGSVAFRARLSASLPWTVDVTDASGATVAGGRGESVVLDWTWNTAAVPAGTYRWSMGAGVAPAAATSATGEVVTGSGTAQLALMDVTAEPTVVSPDGDGTADVATVSYRLTAPATVSAVAADSSGVEVAEVEAPTWRRAGDHAVTFDAAELPDGVYTVELRARSADGAEAAAAVTVTVSRTLNTLTLTPMLLSPNGDGRADVLRIAFTLTRPASVAVRVLRTGVGVTTVLEGPLAPGRRVVRWDGSKRSGTIGDGAFSVLVQADDGNATTHAERAFVSDTTPPRLRLVSRAPLRVSVSEASTLRLTVNGHSWGLTMERARDGDDSRCAHREHAPCRRVGSRGKPRHAPRAQGCAAAQVDSPPCNPLFVGGAESVVGCVPSPTSSTRGAARGPRRDTEGAFRAGRDRVDPASS